MLSSISGSALRVSDAGKERDKNAGAERRHAKAGRRMLSILIGGMDLDGMDGRDSVSFLRRGRS